MHPELERLIKIALADGIITEKERAIILEKAEKVGADKDEVELILDGELALIQSQKSNFSESNPSYKIGETKKCPSCGAPLQALTLKCNECGHDFYSETDSNKLIRDYIRELNDKLIEADNSLSSKQRAWYGEDQIINKKVTIINAFTLPNTKEGLIQLLIFSYSNYESTQDNAFTPNPLRKAWLAKAIQSYNLLKAQGEEDNKIQKVLIDYSFLDNVSQSQHIKNTLTKTSGSTTKKALKYGCLSLFIISLLSMLLSLFFAYKQFN